MHDELPHPRELSSTQKFEFLNKSGKTLNGLIESSPEGKNSPVIVFFGGFSGNTLSERFDPLTKDISKAGYNVVRFNFTEHEQGGNYNNASIIQELGDIEQLFNFLDENGYSVKKGEYGVIAKCFGGFKAFNMDDPRMKALVLIGTSVNSDTSISNEKQNKLQYGPLVANRQKLYVNPNQLKSIPPLLIFHGLKDHIPVEAPQKILEDLGKRPVDHIETFTDGDHGLDAFTSEMVQQIVPFFKSNISNPQK